jgi:hypothetical protein
LTPSCCYGLPASPIACLSKRVRRSRVTNQRISSPPSSLRAPRRCRAHNPERAGGSRARRAGIHGAGGDGYGKRRRPLSGAHTNAAHERATADVKTQVSCGRHSLLFSNAIVISNWYRSKQSFCVNGTLIRCLAIPLYGLTVVLIDANTVVEHPT